MAGLQSYGRSVAVLGKLPKVLPCGNSSGIVSICSQCVTQRKKSLLGHQRTQGFVSSAVQPEAIQNQENNQNLDILTSKPPVQQSEKDYGKFYPIPYNEWNSTLSHGFPQKYNDQVYTFNECRVMVRRPALQVIETLRNLGENETPKFVLYGKDGTGKTLSLCHIIHYCLQDNWIIVQLSRGSRMCTTNRPIQPSPSHKDRYDQPDEADRWLKLFKSINDKKLAKVLTSQRYTWGPKDVTEKDEPILRVIQKGLSRPAYSCDAIGIILKELRLQKSFKILYAVDEFNGFFEQPAPKGENKQMVTHEQLSMIHHFTKFLQPDSSLTSGCYVMALSRSGIKMKTGQSWELEDMMTKKATEKIGQFTPIQVRSYSEMELKNCLAYYSSKNWLHKELSDKLQEEVTFLVGRNPRLVSKLCLGI